MEHEPHVDASLIYSEESDLTIRFTLPEDGAAIRPWFNDPAVLRWFPCLDTWEVDESVQRWVSFARYRACLTAISHGKVVGTAALWLQPYSKLMHQAEFGIIMAPEARGKGMGERLLRQLMRLAKERFHLEWLCLQVYTGNPALHLYERLGFTEYGRQECWIKEPDGQYTGRILMQLKL